VKLYQVIPRGLKCDNPFCDWEDMSIEYKDYELYVNAACPKCGENLLTEECFENVKKQVKTGEEINKMLLDTAQELGLDPETILKGNTASVFFDVDKDGNIVKLRELS